MDCCAGYEREDEGEERLYMRVFSMSDFIAASSAVVWSFS